MRTHRAQLVQSRPFSWAAGGVNTLDAERKAALYERAKCLILAFPFTLSLLVLRPIPQQYQQQYQYQQPSPWHVVNAGQSTFAPSPAADDVGAERARATTQLRQEMRNAV